MSKSNDDKNKIGGEVSMTLSASSVKIRHYYPTPKPQNVNVQSEVKQHEYPTPIDIEGNVNREFQHIHY